MKIRQKVITAAVLSTFVFSGITQASDYAGLKAAIDNTASNTSFTYTLDSDITGIATPLGSMQGAGYALTIDGSSNKYGIGANSVQGVTVQNGQTLIIQNIGSYVTTETDGNISAVTVNSSWNGFKGQRNGGVINQGTAKIYDSVFENNTAPWGGAISNKGELEVKNSVFSENNATITNASDDGGVAIFNDKSKNISLIDNSIFYKNSGRHGGAILNHEGAKITKITGSTFLENNTTTNSGNNAAGGAIYNNGTIEELSDSYFANNTTQRHGGAIYNNGTLTIKGSEFVQNTALNTDNKGEGGAIYSTSAANITITGSKFTDNSSAINGGAISNYGTMSIEADFNENTTSTSGGAIYNKGTITEIKNSNFIKNDATNSGSNGGAIYNEKNALIEKITGSKFENNSAGNEGGAIANWGKINLIEDSEFTGNSVFEKHWGTIYNNQVGTIGTIKGITVTNNDGDGLNSNGVINAVLNSTFSKNKYYGIAMDQTGHILLVDNVTISGNEAGGIVLKNAKAKIDVLKNSTITENKYGIKTGTDLTILSDGGESKIKDNTSTDGENLGIYVGQVKSDETGQAGETTPTLTLKQINNGKTYMYDVIKGNNGYSVNIEGDNTGTLYLYNNIDNGKVTVTTSNVDTADSKLFDYTFKSLDTDSTSSNWKIDVDLFNEKADTIATTTLAQTSVKYVHLKDFNFIDGDWDSLLDGDTKTVQVLKTQNNLQLSLDNSLTVEKLINKKNIDPAHTRYEQVGANTDWNDEFHKWLVDDKFRNTYGKWTLEQTSTANDSLTVKISKREEGGEEHDQGVYGDTLKLVNQNDDYDSREFNANAAGATYTVTEDLGETYGTLTINGKEGNTTETVDLGSNAGFELGTDAVALNLNNITLTGSDTLVTVSNGNAKLNLDSVILDGKVTGSTEFAMTTSGVSEFKDTVDNANITNTGTLTTTAENVANSTVTNNNILNLSGALAKEIKGTGGTTKIDSTLTFNDGAKIAGGLDMNSGALTVSADEITTHEIGSMSGNGTMAIDLKLADATADKLTLSNTSNGTITLSSVNILDPTVTEIDKTFSALVLDANSGSTIKLALSDDVAREFNSKEYVIERIDEKTTYDTIKATTNWSDVYEKHITSAETVFGMLGLSDDKRAIAVSESHREGGTTTDESMGDTLRLVNEDTTNTDKTFKTDSANYAYIVTEDVGSTVGNLTIQGVAKDEGGERIASTVDFDGHNGFDLNNGTGPVANDATVTLKDVTIKNAAYIAKSDSEDSVINLDGAILFGSNGDGIETAGKVNITGASDIKDKITLTSDNASVNVNNTKDTKISSTLSGTGTFNINNSVLTLEKAAKVENLNTTLDNSTLNLKDENSISGVNAAFNGSNTLNIMNKNVGALSLGNVNLNGTLKMMVDADLANKRMDTLSATSAQISKGSKINVEKINLLSPTKAKKLSILFTDNKDLAKIVNYKGDKEIAYSPIYKYKTAYEVKNDMGYFTFGRSSKHPDFNPAVLASPVMAQAGMMANMSATMNYAFEHLDGFTKIRSKDRFAIMNANKYAMGSTDFNNNNMSLDELYENKGAWVIPYASFENIHLKNGPRVDANSYGTFTGFDTDFKQLSHGWNTVFTGYLAYNGAHLSYQGVSTLMNGGMMGATQTWYKGNFWTALTATAGASVAESDTMYGHEDYASILAGIGSKTGYNFELADGKFIIQPMWFMNYSFIKTFDYTNAAGVRIDSDPLHTIQLNPNIRFIGNFKNGWQPYASVGMVWNLMNETHVVASGAKLPEMSVKPYVEYGAGVQKSFGERFTGYLQAMLRNGGRNGIALSGGFRWALGRTGGSSQKVTYRSHRVVRSNYQNTAVPQKKVLKQLSDSQKARLVMSH